MPGGWTNKKPFRDRYHLIGGIGSEEKRRISDVSTKVWA